MSYKITNISNNTIFYADEGESILAAALRNGHIYNSGCQLGLCGSCKSQLISGSVDMKGQEESLSEEEKSHGTVLLCTAIPEGDISINATEVVVAEGIEIKTLPSRICEKNKLAEDVVQLFLRLPKNQTFQFLPGQYLNILLEGDKHRSFSIANTPEVAADKGVELHIRLVSQGLYTPHIFADADVKDIVRFQGPFGTYFLRTDNERPIIMVAGGTGFAPIKGLLEQAIDSGLSQPIKLFWGVRTAADLYQNELAEAWAAEHDHIEYIPVLSEPDDDWQGDTGFVHEAVLRQVKDFAGISVYTSGPPVMVNAVRDSFLAKGLDEEFLYSDSFDYAAVAESSG